MRRDASNSTSSCLDDGLIEDLVTGARVDERKLEAARKHAEGCVRCADRLAEASRGLEEVTRVAPMDRVLGRKDRIGELIDGKYAVLALLGSGGSGTVVRARHVELNSTVAIKLLGNETPSDQAAMKRLLNEARIAASLRSQNVVRVIDLGNYDGGALYVVMEDLQGVDLGQLVVRDGPASPQQVVEWMVQALDAIVEAHRAKLVHRALKPQNLFLTNAGVIKVLDFGVSMSLLDASPQTQVTQPNALHASPRYMAPEQLESPSTVDQRADIWSLGATMFYLLTGQSPFVEQDVLALTRRILNEHAPRAREIAPDTPTSLDALIARCLQPDRQRRHTTSAVLLAELVELRRTMPRSTGDSARVRHSPAGAKGSFSSSASITPPVPSEPRTLQKRVAPPPEVANLSEPIDELEPTQLAPNSLPTAAPPLPKIHKMYGEEDEPPESGVPGRGHTVLMPTAPGPVAASRSSEGSVLRPRSAPAPFPPRAEIWAPQQAPVMNVGPRMAPTRQSRASASALVAVAVGGLLVAAAAALLAYRYLF